MRGIPQFCSLPLPSLFALILLLAVLKGFTGACAAADVVVKHFTQVLPDQRPLKDSRPLPSGLRCRGNVFPEKLDNKRDLIIQGDYVSLSDPLSLLLHFRN